MQVLSSLRASEDEPKPESERHTLHPHLGSNAMWEGHSSTRRPPSAASAPGMARDFNARKSNRSNIARGRVQPRSMAARSKSPSGPASSDASCGMQVWCGARGGGKGGEREMTDSITVGIFLGMSGPLTCRRDGIFAWATPSCAESASPRRVFPAHGGPHTTITPLY
jgi:hypothetical protein